MHYKFLQCSKPLLNNTLTGKSKLFKLAEGEFIYFSSLLADYDIQFRHPCPHIHNQNGRIEKKHRHIVDISLTLLAQSKLPLNFWWNAFQTVVFLLNRLPTPVLNNVSPFFKLFQ